jgi:hypothetical protein
MVREIGVGDALYKVLAFSAILSSMRWALYDPSYE